MLSDEICSRSTQALRLLEIIPWVSCTLSLKKKEILKQDTAGTVEYYQ